MGGEEREMQRISRQHSLFYLSGDDRPVATAESGETVVFETKDCYNGQITSEDILYSDIPRGMNNPATGPLYVAGAEPGDTLKVEILDIRVGDWGIMTARPGDGALKDFFSVCKTKIIPIKGDTAFFDEKISFPVDPMVGVIGVAPAGERIKTTIPGRHGGNLDCKRIGKNSAVYLPVTVSGGLLSMGDLHAVMADGEVVICGLETSGEVTVRVTLLKGLDYPLPLVVTGDKFITVAAGQTLDEAASLATVNLQRLLISHAGLDPYAAAMLLSLAGDLAICQVVNPLKTCRMEFPLRILSEYGCRLP